MEIKTSNGYPLWLIKLLSENKVYKTVVNCYHLNLRTSPMYGSNIYKVVKLGTKVEYLGIANGWARIKYENKTLYCGINYLK